MYYPPAKFDDDMFSGFSFRVLTYIHTYTRTYVQSGKTPYSCDYIGVSKYTTAVERLIYLIAILIAR